MQDFMAIDTKRGGEQQGTWLPAPLPHTNRQRMLAALHCSPVDRPPLWLMRQAGRCLPEYRALKEKYTFRELVQEPELAAEVTLQPIRRFNFDAAIIFSDILVVPEALGQGYSFRETGGVKMDFTIKDRNDIRRLNTESVSSRLQYVADAIRLTKARLLRQTALLGFVGSPWTLANFMLEGGSSREFSKALHLFEYDRALYDSLAEELTLAVIDFLQLQIEAGVDAVQIFDTLGSGMAQRDFEEASGKWIRMIVSAINGRVPVIVFSKGCRSWDSLIRTGAQAIGIDHGIDLAAARKEVPGDIAMQGNLAPELLVDATPMTVAAETRRLLELMRDRAGYVFNLGHGVPPEAKMENLEALVSTVQNFV